MSEELKTYGKDKDGVDKVMSSKDLAGDALGQISANAINSMTGQMTYFYTTKLGMDPTMAGNVQLFAKIADGISDIIMGRMVDKTNTKDGKARPWLKRMVIPTFLALILLFCVPAGASSGMQFIYAVATNIFASAIVYTAIFIPYYTMLNYETKSQEERGKIGSFRGFLGYMIGQGISIALLPITNAMGGTQSSWIIFAAVLGAIASITLLVCFKMTRERYQDHAVGVKSEEDEMSFGAALKVLVKNIYWWEMLVAQVCLSGVYTFMYGGMAFYCAYVLGNDNLVAVVGSIGLIPSIIGFVSAPLLIKKLGMRKTGIFACVIGLIGTVIRLMFPESMVVFTLGHCLVTYATAPVVAVLPAMTINCAEWNDYKAGVKLTGMTNSVASFGGKIGTGIAGASIGWILAAAKFDGAAMTQSASTLGGIKFLNVGMPGVMLLLIMLMLIAFTLDGKYKDVVEANAARRAAK